MKHLLTMKKTILLFVLFFATLLANAQNNTFITRWNLATSGTGATQLVFNIETSKML